MKQINLFPFILFLLVVSTAFAQDEKDKTGTNPVNFTYDVRMITELQQFPDNGGSLIKQTAEFRWPLGRDIGNLGSGDNERFYSVLGSRFGLRFRAYYNFLNVNSPASTVSGIGDFDARFLAIAYAGPKFILAPGLEGFFDTASNDALGSGSNSLAPVLFAVFPGLVGKGSLFAPGYQYVFSVSGNKVSRSQIDLYFVWVLAKGKNWFLLDPQIIIDHENSAWFMTIDAEWGFMIAPGSGLSGYIRPGAGIGEDRPFNYNLEFAIKYVWG